MRSAECRPSGGVALWQIIEYSVLSRGSLCGDWDKLVLPCVGPWTLSPPWLAPSNNSWSYLFLSNLYPWLTVSRLWASRTLMLVTYWGPTHRAGLACPMIDNALFLSICLSVWDARSWNYSRWAMPLVCQSCLVARRRLRHVGKLVSD